MSIFQIVFLENMFLTLTDEEKAGEERSTAEKIVLTCQRMQIINFKKSQDLIRKIRNVIKPFLYYYKQFILSAS